MNLKIILHSSYSWDVINANSIRIRYFFKEFNKNFNTNLIYSFFSPSENNRPLWWRLFKEILLGIEMSFRFCFLRRDIFFLSSPPYFTTLIICLSLTILKKKFILDIRDPYPEVFFYLNIISLNSFKGKLLMKATRFVISRSLGVVTATKGIETIIKSYQLDKKIITIFNGFDSSFFKGKNKKFNTFTLIFHGNLARMQNIDLLIEIAQRCPRDINILVIGDGPKKKKIIQSKRITYLGKLSYENTMKIISKAHVGLSFRNDGLINKISFPVKTFEYMGAGLPIIITPKSEAGDFLESRQLGYQFHNREINEVVNKIIFLKQNYKIHNPPFEFTRQNQAKKLVCFINSLLNLAN